MYAPSCAVRVRVRYAAVVLETLLMTCAILFDIYAELVRLLTTASSSSTHQLVPPQRWNCNADDPNRGFKTDVERPRDECVALMDMLGQLRSV